MPTIAKLGAMLAVVFIVGMLVTRHGDAHVERLKNTFVRSSMVAWVAENIVRPSPRSEPYNLRSPGANDFSQIGQQAVLDKYFKGKRDGRFLEVGAFDGERFSNTLVYERDYNWEGVLVEVDNQTFTTLLGKRRKSYAINCCLWDVTSVGYATMDQLGSGGHVVLADERTPKSIPCVTIGAVFDYLGWTHVDLLSLDTETTEDHIVLGMPFDRIQVDYVLIEVNAMGRAAAAVATNTIVDAILINNGFEVVESIWKPNRKDDIQDKLWRRKSLA